MFDLKIGGYHADIYASLHADYHLIILVTNTSLSCINRTSPQDHDKHFMT